MFQCCDENSERKYKPSPVYPPVCVLDNNRYDNGSAVPLRKPSTTSIHMQADWSHKNWSIRSKMRSGIGLRQRSKVETNDGSANVGDDERDDTTASEHPIDPRNNSAIVMIDTDSKPLFRSTSPKVEYAASSPYYDVLLYSFTPEQEAQKQRKFTRTTSTNSKYTRTSSTNSKQTEQFKMDNELAVKSIATGNEKLYTQQLQPSLPTKDNDNIGDGDQSPIYDPYMQKRYLELFRIGGDFDAHVQHTSNHNNSNSRRYFPSSSTTNHPTLSVFAEHCVSGRYTKVKQMLENNSVRKGKSWNANVELLETRETALRLSPLLIVFCMMHKIGIVMMNKSDSSTTGDAKSELNRTVAADAWMKYIDQLEQNLVKVVAELLRYGASPIARDVCGRTVYFYGASIYATPRSLNAVTMCGNAAMTAYYFGKEVQLHGFDTTSVVEGNTLDLRNGMRGLVGGYQVYTGCRIVFLFGRQSEVAVAPRNFRLINASDRIPDSMLNLCNVQDRLGQVCLNELYGSKRTDVLRYLLDKHNASIDVEDWTGKSIRHRSFEISANANTKTSELLDDEMASAQTIVAHALKCARQEQKRSENTCSSCKQTRNNDDDSKILQVCQRCMSVKYCSEKCQVDHWANCGHRKQCSRLRKLYNECITIDELSISDTVQSGKKPSFGKPSHVAYDEAFTVKIEFIGQQNVAGFPVLHIYDKSLECDFNVKCNETSGTTSCTKLLEKVKADSVTVGTAIYLAASFDVNGECSIYINRKKARTW